MYVHMDVKYASNKLENAYITKWIKTNKGGEEEKRKTSAIYTTTYNVYQCKQRSLKLKLFSFSQIPAHTLSHTLTVFCVQVNTFTK